MNDDQLRFCSRSDCSEHNPQPVSNFYVRSGGRRHRECKTCIKRRSKRWHQSNPDKVKDIQARYRQNHPGYNQKYDQAFTERGGRQKTTARRRHRLLSLPFELTDEQWRATLRHFDHRCAYCGRRQQLCQEHVVPVVQGGGYTADNIVPACKSCNSRKGPRTPKEAGMVIRKPWPIKNLQMDQAA